MAEPKPADRKPQSGGHSYKMTSIRLRTDLKKKAKNWANDHDSTLQEIIEQALKDWLRNKRIQVDTP